jgi:hypothetical protein
MSPDSPIFYFLFVIPLGGLAASVGIIAIKLEYPESMSWSIAVPVSIISLLVAIICFLMAIRMIQVA